MPKGHRSDDISALGCPLSEWFRSAFVLAADGHPRASKLLAWVRERLAVNETDR